MSPLKKESGKKKKKKSRKTITSTSPAVKKKKPSSYSEVKTLKLSTASCSECPLFNSSNVTNRCATEYCPSSLSNKDTPSSQVDVLFITDAPGQTENKRGRQVVGPEGRFLCRVVRKVNGGTEKGVAYGTAVQCIPYSTGKKSDVRKPPTSREIDCCSPNIKQDIAKLKPKQIVLLGTSVASLALNPRDNFKKIILPLNSSGKVTGIQLFRGLDFVVEDSEGSRYPAIFTWSLEDVLRNSRCLGSFKEDISRAFRRAKRKDLPDYSGRGKKAIILDTLPKVRKYLKKLKDLSADDIVAIDYETVGLNRINPTVLTIGFAHGPDRGYVIPWRHPESPWTGKEFRRLRKMVGNFFSDSENGFGALVAHNLKFECAVTREEFGVYLNHFPLEDVLLLAYSLDETRGGKKGFAPGYGLKTLVEEWMGFYHYRDYDIAPIVQFIKTGRSADAPLHELCEYNAIDCYATYRLYRTCYDMAIDQGYVEKLQSLSRNLLGPLSAFVAQMENNGFRMSKERLRALMADDSPIIERMQEVEAEFKKLPNVQQANLNLRRSNKRTGGMKSICSKSKDGPWVFNIRTPDHRVELFVNVMGLDTPEKTKKLKAPSVNEAFYQKFKDRYDEARLAWEWTTLGTLRSLFIEKTYKIVQSDPDMKDGRVRSTYWLYSTDTGRLASSDPNLQQIPSRDKHKYTKEIKKMYYAEPGYLLVCADYSQAEVRWLAVEAKDDVLCNAFKSVMAIKEEYKNNPTAKSLARMKVDGDFHMQTASKVFKKSPDKISKDERSKSKSVVFGIIYGQTKYGLARNLKSTPEEAEAFQEKFLDQFSGVKDFLYNSEDSGFTNGYVDSSLGRRKHLGARLLFGDENKEANKSNDMHIRGAVQHENNISRNAPIQSEASDTNLMACIRLQNYIEEHGLDWKLVNVVHDSIIAEIPFGEVEHYVRVAKQIMEDPDIFSDFGIHLSVPFEADFSAGFNWGSQFEVKLAEKWKVSCKKCKKERHEEGGRPTNRRCEECGSKEVRFHLVEGPLKKLLKKLSKMDKSLKKVS